ncbi:MAG: hypothetical protein H6734_15925 [Alphaproteobacteria bacterium]|nr:hypothetical protein [Alphaproteobacteria bacterium]
MMRASQEAVVGWSEHVLPHGELRELVPGLWQVEGTLSRGPLPRNMVVARLPDGRLWLHSVVAMDDARQAQLEALGSVAFIVVPSGMHRADAGVYAERYPDARVVCPAAAREAVEKVVRVHGTCEDELPAAGVHCVKPAGLKPDELVYEVPVAGGVALVFCDALFNLPDKPGCGGMIMRLMGSSGFFGTTRLGRMLMSDMAGWKAWLLETAERDDLRALSVAHGDPIVDRCGDRLREAAGRL